MDKIYIAKKWVPELEIVAKSITDDIHNAAPGLEVLFMGAAALGLPGKNDIDLDILCPQSEVGEYTHKLKKVLGLPKERSETQTTWNFERNGFEIDIVLSDPTLSHVPKQKQIFDELQSNPSLLEKYRQLKVDCDKMSYQEYEQRKREFYSTYFPDLG